MSRLLKLVRAERGLALPLALLVMAVSGATVVTVLEVSSSTGRTAHVAKSRMSAESLAEAGLANAFAVLYNPNNNPTTVTLLGCNAGGTSCTPTVSTYPGGTATWSGWLDSTGGSSVWRITSIGQVANPTAAASSLRITRKATVPLQVTTGTPNAAVWNYLYSTRAPGSGCEVDVNGSNVVIDIPLYVTGDLCLSGSNVEIDERGEGQNPPPQPIDLRVGGKLVFSGSNATVGKSSDYITSAAVAGGCTTTINGSTQTCARPPFNWYVQTVNTFQTLTAPTADYASWFAHNDTINSTSTVAGQDGDCDVRSGTPPNINPDTLLDADAGTVNIFPNASYTCRKTVDGTAGGAVVSELSWNHNTDVLTVKGAIIVDGHVTVSGSNTGAIYNGSATLYVNGTFTMNGSNQYVCANTNCEFTTWNPNTEMLIIVANAATLDGSNVKWQGGLFCNPTSTANFAGSNVEVHGPVICGRFTFGSNTAFKPLPAITSLPIGAPVEPNVSVEPGTPAYGG